MMLAQANEQDVLQTRGRQGLFAGNSRDACQIIGP